jgi:hypothetical protein
MTDVKTTLRSAYLAGPMRGIEEYNFPEFRKQTAWLRGLGWEIFSPAERDEQDPEIDHTEDIAGWTGSRGLDYFMAHDLKAVCEMDAVICLPGWEASQGARLETVTAVEVGHPVFEIARDLKGYGRYLKSVSNDYVQAVFAARGVPQAQPVAAWGFEVDDDYPTDFERAYEPPVPTVDAEGFPEPEPQDEMLSPTNAIALAHRMLASALPTGSEARKGVPLARGVLDYFPAALAEVARVSKAGNDKHNPGQDMHHARGKSTDHADCLLRHLVDRGKVDVETGQRHSAEVAWRALALLQPELEDEGLAPLPRGARLPEEEA